MRLRSLLERLLFDAESGKPVGEVDLRPLRQLLAALVNCGNRHDAHLTDAPKAPDACARGKPGCYYCRYGFPHALRPREDCLLIEQGTREGQWDARFPRNDKLVGSFEPHVLLANLGNVDWKPMMNLWAVVEYVSKYAMKVPGKTKTMREVLRSCIEEVCKYTKDSEGGDLFRKCLQKFYSKSIGGRDYGVFEAVHAGLNLPFVYSLLPVETLNTTGVRVYKSGDALKKAQERGAALTYDSKADKFDKRLSLVREAWRGSHRREDRAAGSAARGALAAAERSIRDVSFYEFYSKHYWKRSQVKTRAVLAALQVAPGFSADCAAVDHGLHQAYAKANVLAFWRLMPTRERNNLAVYGSVASFDTRKCGSTLLELPPMHGAGEPSLLDRFLGLGDLCEAFETGVQRKELVWACASESVPGRWVARPSTKRPRNCDWSFAMLEMFVDPVLQAWVPKWVVEQYERRNPDFRAEVDKKLQEDKTRSMSNRQLLLSVRRSLLDKAKRRKADADRTAANGKGGEGDGDSGASSGDGSDDDREGGLGVDESEADARRRMIKEALPGDDDFDGDDGGAGAGDEGCEDGAWAARSAEERASAAAPAPELKDRVVPPRLRCFVQGVSINPENHDWVAENVVSLEEAKRMKELADLWCGQAAGGQGEHVREEDMDPEQRFAYRIHRYKMKEREDLERRGLLSKYRALRKILTGPPGSGKSRTVRAIAVMRAAAARSAAERAARMQRGVKKDMVTKRGDEAARGACLLGAPTGTASFQIKAGASTLHRLFSIPIHQFLPIRDAGKLAKLARCYKAATLFGLDEFSMIGRQMLGKISDRVDQVIGTEIDEGMLKSMGGKDVMLSGDVDQAAPIGDDSIHKEGASKKEGVRGTRDASGRVKEKPDGAKEAWELSDIGLVFRKEFDDVVILETRHRFVDPSEEDVPEESMEVFVDDLKLFGEVMDRLANLSITREDIAWLSKRNRSRLSAEERRQFDDAVLLMDTNKQRVERGNESTQLDGADYKNLEELYKLAAKKGVPVVRFGSYHSKRQGEEGMRAELMADDDFGLAAN